ncbi:hypothetical protein D3C81_1831400 [compost metagenome]
MNTLEVAHYFLFAAFGNAPLFLFLAVEGDDQVVLLATTQRVMHQVATRACPEHRRVDAQVLRHILFLDHRAVHHVPGHTRRLTMQRIANHRAHSVAADHGIGAVGIAVTVGQRYAIGVLLKVFNAD